MMPFLKQLKNKLKKSHGNDLINLPCSPYKTAPDLSIAHCSQSRLFVQDSF